MPELIAVECPGETAPEVKQVPHVCCPLPSSSRRPRGDSYEECCKGRLEPIEQVAEPSECAPVICNQGGNGSSNCHDQEAGCAPFVGGMGILPGSEVSIDCHLARIRYDRPS